MQAFLDVLNDFALTFAPFLNEALAKIADLVIKLIFLFFFSAPYKLTKLNRKKSHEKWFDSLR